MGKTLLFAMLAFGLNGLAPAQPMEADAAIVGRVGDAESAEPVEFANVVLYRLPDSVQVQGTVTDRTGGFALTAVRPGRYYLEISFIGYRSRVVDDIECASGARLDLGRVNLVAVLLPVEGTEATATTPAITRKLDRTVIEVARLPNAGSGTAVDALRNAPSVKVDIDENVTLRGSANFRVLVDGRPSELEPADALKQIPAASIDRIEIITNPSAKYDPEGAAGIINILLKKQKGPGISGMANANAGPGNRYGADLLAGYREGKANVYGGGNVNRYAWKNRVESESRIIPGDDTLATAVSGSGHGGPLLGGIRAGGDLQLGPRDRAGLTGRVRAYDGGGDMVSDATERRLPSGPTRRYLNEQNWRWQTLVFFGMADYEHGFDTSGHKVSGRLSLINRNGNSSGSSQEIEAEDTVYGRRNEQSGPWRRLVGELAYARPELAGGKLESGYEGRWQYASGRRAIWVYDRAARAYLPDTLSDNSNTGTNGVHAAYATWNREWHGLGIQPGLRVEYEDRRIRVISTDSVYEMKRLDVFPSLHLSYGLPAQQQVTAGYSRRVNRPGIWELDPSSYWESARSVRQGNPELAPEFTDSWEAGYTLPLGRNSVNTAVYYRVTHDLKQWVTMKYAGDTAALLSTPRNVGRDRSLGCELSADLSPWQWLTVAPGADLYDYRVEGNLPGQDFSRKSFAWSGSLSLTLRTPFGTQAQLDGNYSAPTVTSQGRQGGWFGTDLAVKQTLLNRALAITLRVGSLLGGVPWEDVSAGPGFSSSSSFYHEPRVITLAVSYNLNNFRPSPKMRTGEGEEMQGGPGR